MRLRVLHDGFRPLQRVPLWLMRTVMGTVPPPIAVLSYRREVFGARFAPAIQEAMRGGRHWTPGETELFAAYVSKLNDCAY